MRVELKHLELEPDPATLSGDASEFSLLARMMVGQPDTPGEESFDVTVCTPEWLARQCVEQGGIYDPRHHLIVTLDTFHKRKLHDWFETRVQSIEGDNWAQIAERLGRLGRWEFEDYKA